MSAPDVLSANKELTNEQGFVNVDKDTMQHLKYKNVFAIGDCSGTPNSKTAAAAGKFFTVLLTILTNSVSVNLINMLNEFIF